MKNQINRLSKLLLLPLIVLMSFTACQDEVTDVTDPDQQETIVANSPLANLVANTTLRDGSYDNIVDNANCLSIELPVTIIANGFEITIDGDEDYEVIEAIFDQFSDDEDILEVIFPITIITSDYTEIIINNLEELNQLIEECTDENEDDDDIECIDFQYPITISVFDSNFDVIDTVTIESDEALYHFIDELDGGVLASINFPVTMINADGTEVVVNNNDELQAAIEAAEDTCDEDDDNDYNDDDNVDISVEELGLLLTECTWTVDELEIDNEDLEDQYEGYVFTFFENGVVKAYINGNYDEGTWELIQTDAGIRLNLQMNSLTDFNNELWQLHEIEDEYGEFEIEFRSGSDELSFAKHECDNAPAVCPEEEVDASLSECYWRVGFNGDNNFAEYEFYFNENDDLVIQHSVNDQEIVGFWSTDSTASGATVMTFEIGEPLSDINGEWSIIECSDERVKMVMGDLYLVFERECEEDGCTEDQVVDYLVECIWNVVNYNESNDLIVYDLDFSGDGVVVISGDGQTITAQYVTSVTADGVWVLFDGVNGANIQAISGNWLITECREDRFKMVNDNNGFMVLEQDCTTDEGCSESDVDASLFECPWTISSFAGDNGFNIFNIVFEENQEATIYTENESEVYTANWTTSQGTNGVEVEISNISGGNVQIIEATYVVVECTPEQLILHDVSNSDNELVLDIDCN